MCVQPCAREELVNLGSQSCSSTGMSQLPDRQLFTTPACSGPFLKGSRFSFLIAVLGQPGTAAKEFIHGIFPCLSVVPTTLRSH